MMHCHFPVRRLAVWFFLVSFFLIAFPPGLDAGKKEINKKEEVTKVTNVEQGVNVKLTLTITSTNRQAEPHPVVEKTFALGEPIPVSRVVDFFPAVRSVNGFYLPCINRKPFQYKDVFTGDVTQGGSCNVDILEYVPHGLTHIETSAHILKQDNEAFTIKDVPLRNLDGLIYLMDLTDLEAKPGNPIEAKDIVSHLEKMELPASMLAIKTKASLLSQDFDFSGKDFLFLSPGAARLIHDLEPQINCLLLDLPSIDREEDGGKLAAHRAFFGLQEKGHEAVDKEKRTLVELAYFKDLDEGYYYCSIVPQRFQANAVATGVLFRRLHPVPTGQGAR